MVKGERWHLSLPLQPQFCYLGLHCHRQKYKTKVNYGNCCCGILQTTITEIQIYINKHKAVEKEEGNDTHIH